MKNSSVIDCFCLVTTSHAMAAKKVAGDKVETPAFCLCSFDEDNSDAWKNEEPNPEYIGWCGSLEGSTELSSPSNSTHRVVFFISSAA